MLRLTCIFLLFSSIISCQKQNEKEFTFASSGEFRPFSYVNDEGKMEGYDIDVGTEIAKRLNLAAKPVKYKFAAIVEGVKSHRFNAAVASHTITPEREEHVSFSTPYYFSGPQVFLREKEKVADYKDKDIAVSKGSTYAEMAKTFTKKVSVYDSDITALEALDNGRHDIVITDAITGAMAIKRGLKIQGGEILGESRQAIAVAKEDNDLLEKINEALDSMKTDGTLKSLGEKYFGRDISISVK